MTPRWALAAAPLFIAGITGCLSPPPKVETPVSPPASQEVALPDESGAEAKPEANGVKLLSPRMGGMRKISGTQPWFPAELRLSGRTYVVLAKICVSNAGVVDSVSILGGNQPALATNVVNAVKEWRYAPLTVNDGPAVPFCYPARFEFKTI